jgi:predicted CoA-binding protein
MSTLHYTDNHIASVLKRTKTIAMLGASPKSHRASNRVMQFLQKNNYRVIPVTIQKGVEWILGERVYPTLALIPDEFEMVDIFRKVDYALEITQEIIALSKYKKIETIWMQLDIQNDQAANIAEKSGLDIIMDRCPAIDIRRLIKTGHLSSSMDERQ